MSTKMQEQIAKQSAQIDKLLQQAADSTKQILQRAEQNSKVAKARNNNSRPPKAEKPEREKMPPKRERDRQTTIGSAQNMQNAQRSIGATAHLT